MPYMDPMGIRCYIIYKVYLIGRYQSKVLLATCDTDLSLPSMDGTGCGCNCIRP